eukprot:jgi/Mesvir1/10217/Mv08537-RA.1
MASVITAPVDVANKVTESVGDAASATAKKVGFVREDGKLAPMFAVTLAVMMGLSVFTATDSLIAGMFPSTATGGKRYAKMAGASVIGFAAFVGAWSAFRR